MALQHAVSGEVVTLHRITDADAKTVALMKTPSFETVQLVLREGEHIPGHAVAGSLSLYCIAGAAEIALDGGERRLDAGDWLYLEPQARHAVRALTDTSLLLTILFDHS